MKNTIERITSVIAAVILLQTLYFKFTGAPESVFIFSQLGLEPYGRVGLGIVELITAVLLIVKRTSFVGALVGIGIMMGAIVSHLFVLGIVVQNDGGLLFTLAIIVFFMCLVTAILQKEKYKAFKEAGFSVQALFT